MSCRNAIGRWREVQCVFTAITCFCVHCQRSECPEYRIQNSSCVLEIVVIDLFIFRPQIDVQHEWITKNLRCTAGKSVMVDSTFSRVFQFNRTREPRKSARTRRLSRSRNEYDTNSGMTRYFQVFSEFQLIHIDFIIFTRFRWCDCAWRFQLAIKCGNYEMVKKLLPHCKLTHLDINNNSMFHYASSTTKEIINVSVSAIIEFVRNCEIWSILCCFSCLRQKVRTTLIYAMQKDIHPCIWHVCGISRIVWRLYWRLVPMRIYTVHDREAPAVSLSPKPDYQWIYEEK